MSKISSNYNGREELEAQYRAQQERKEEIRDQNESEIENLKRNYNAQKADLEDRFERSVQGERLQHYENLRNQKSQIQRETMQLETAGRQHIQQKSEALGKTEHQIEVEGSSKINELKQKYVAAEAYEQQQMQSAQEQIRGDHRKNAETILKDSERNIAALHDEKKQQLEKHQETHASALNQMSEHYSGLRDGVQKSYETGLQSLQQRTRDELGQKQLGYSKLIEAYQKRADDPFYKINRYDSDMLDVGDKYVLRVKVPDYERGQFRVQVAGQEIQLMGIRSNQEKTEIEPGRWIATNSHQTISERYPLDAPVDSRAMTMREEGDWLEYHLPKFGKNHRYSDVTAPKGMDREQAALIKEIEFPASLPRPTISRKDSGGPVGSGSA
jgi:HSP20 family molecular chaperone IbpA